MTDIKEIEKLIPEMFRIANKLTTLTGRPFTLDGHMVGSIGEFIGKYYYSIDLYPPSHTIHDGSWNGRDVQIKATQRNSVDLKGLTDLLLVLKINPDGTFKEIYNGDGRRPWKSLSHRKITGAGEISISLRQLSILNEQVNQKDKIYKIQTVI